jgi:hypothetical protein
MKKKSCKYCGYKDGLFFSHCYLLENFIKNSFAENCKYFSDYRLKIEENKKIQKESNEYIKYLKSLKK